MGWSISWLDIVLAVLTIVGAVYYFGTKSFNFFKKRGICFEKPFFAVGTMLQLVVQRKHQNILVQESYNKFYNEKYFGFFFFTTPTLVVKDLELIKQITVKHFDHFTDHFQIIDERDPLMHNQLLNLQGEKWHQMRTTLSPAFTGSKMKEMMPFVTECSERLIEFLNKKYDTSEVKEKGLLELELRDVMTKCSNDVIASCAFGIQIDSLTDPDNEFYTTSKRMSYIDMKNGLKFLATKVFPVLRNVVTANLMDPKIADYYRIVVMDIIKSRTESGIVRRDMIHLLMLAMKGSLVDDNVSEKTNDDIGFSTVHEELKAKHLAKKIWTDDEITAQAVLFLFAGFETTTSVFTLMAYELATNPETQTRLREEVDEYIKETGGMITYNDIRNLKYMDMAMSETLRLWPPAGNTDRLCVKSFTLPPSNGREKNYEVEKGDMVWIPIYSIHRDPQYFPNPDAFIPERFSEENKGSIKSGAYLPFGMGPRSCIGNRFALMEAKVMMFHLIANYEFIQTPKTDVPIQIKPHPFNIHSKTGFWMGLKKRQTIA